MQNSINKNVIFIMGVSGSGKSSVGQLLANELDIPFIDADDHHLPENIKKMSQGVPLTDNDRIPWLKKLNKIAFNHIESGAVIACSGLKKTYRNQLSQSIESNVCWVYLKGDYNLIFQRMKNRNNHFMNTDMLKSQFDTLQEPKNSITIDIVDSLETIINEIKAQLI